MNEHEIYKTAARILETGENIALITVISTAGSTPGKVGYKMLVWGKNPETFGTVGGGLTEAELIRTAKNTLPRTVNQIFSFNLDGTKDDEKGICGGSIEFLVETFDKKTLPLFRQLSTLIENGGRGTLVSVIAHQRPPEKILLKKPDQLDAAADIILPPESIESVKKLIAKEQPAKIKLNPEVQIFIEPVSEQPMVFLFGAGHLSYYISKYAKSLNFRVTVCDERAEFANKDRFPDANNIVVENFESVFDRINVDENSYIVIVTKGHKSDEIVLAQAVKTKAKYIGMIGSKRKTLTIFEKLSERQIPQELLKRVYSPIGISIGALTPEEIAFSIVGELLKIRRLGNAPRISHMTVTLSEDSKKELL